MFDPTDDGYDISALQPNTVHVIGDIHLTSQQDFLDIDSLAELVQFSQDVAMQGYAPQTSIEVQKNLAGETFTHRKMFLRYKPLGRFIKDQPGN